MLRVYTKYVQKYKINEIYKDIKSKIHVCANGISSEYFNCSAGVRQGEHVSSFLFSLYINDVEDYYKDWYFGQGLSSIANWWSGYQGCSNVLCSPS